MRPGTGWEPATRRSGPRGREAMRRDIDLRPAECNTKHPPAARAATGGGAPGQVRSRPFRKKATAWARLLTPSLS